MTRWWHPLEAWRRYWFAPASLTALGVSRIALVGIVLYLNQGNPLRRVPIVPAAHWQPVPVLAAFGVGQIDMVTAERLGLVLWVALVAAGVGIFTRTALAVAFVLFATQEAMLNSFGKVSHATIPLVYALFLFALAPSGSAFALGAVRRRARAAGRAPLPPPPPERTSPDARWPLDLVFFELASFYLLAGLSKLHTSGLKWADGSTLQYFLLYKGTPGGAWLAAHWNLCVLFSGMVLAFELGAMLGMVRRVRPFVLAGIVCFHAATTYFMNVSFWPVAALGLVFVPWDRLGTALARMTGLAQRRLDLLFDGGCALCRRTVSIVRDLDLAGVVRPTDISVERPPPNVPAIDARRRCEAMHVVDEQGGVTAGYDAFRRLAWVLPAGWPVLPVLYLPVISSVARRVYAFVAARRRTTSCALHAPVP